MTATPSWTIHCDHCGDNMGPADLGDRTATDAREKAKFDGGHVSLLGGRDVCVDCWKEGKR